MAKEKKEKKAAAPAVETKAKAKASDADKAAKKKARLEALKNRPAGQRTNSKQIDIIPTESGYIKNYAAVIRGIGVIVTSVAFNKNDEVLSTSVTFIPGPLAVKTKKGHGYIKLAKGVKLSDLNKEEDEDEDDVEVDEEED